MFGIFSDQRVFSTMDFNHFISYLAIFRCYLIEPFLLMKDFGLYFISFVVIDLVDVGLQTGDDSTLIIDSIDGE